MADDNGKTLRVLHGGQGWSAHEVQCEDSICTYWQLYDDQEMHVLDVEFLIVDSDIDLIQKGYEAANGSKYEEGFKDGQDELRCNFLALLGLDGLVEKINNLTGS